MEKINEIIDRLKSLDLSTYPINELYTLISDLGKIPSILVDLHPGKVIMRARPINDEKEIQRIADVSYKPKQLNTTFRRASVPGRSMFYGCIVPENEHDREIINNNVSSK